jgi:CRP-like cAMP-binding protein
MRPTHSRRRRKAAKTSLAGGRPAVANTLLLGLSRKESEQVFSKLKFMKLPVRSVLNEMAEPIEFGYFINSGLASVLSVMKDGKSVEVGLTGVEGFVGVPRIVGLKTSPTRVIMQVAGSGFRVRAKDLKGVLQNCKSLEIGILRYAQELAMQAAQVAACNRLHEVAERLARWLLMSQDRLGGEIVPLTQEFLAHMLGTRRASVTIAAGTLQEAGLIAYSRGAVRIKDRSGLEDAACECYAAIVRQTRTWRNEGKELGPAA